MSADPKLIRRLRGQPMRTEGPFEKLHLRKATIIAVNGDVCDIQVGGSTVTLADVKFLDVGWVPKVGVQVYVLLHGFNYIIVGPLFDGAAREQMASGVCTGSDLNSASYVDWGMPARTFQVPTGALIADVVLTIDGTVVTNSCTNNLRIVTNLDGGADVNGSGYSLHASAADEFSSRTRHVQITCSGTNNTLTVRSQGQRLTGTGAFRASSSLYFCRVLFSVPYVTS